MSVFIYFTLMVSAVVYLESRRHRYQWERLQAERRTIPKDRWF